MPVGTPSQKEPPKVPDNQALILHSRVHPDATLPQAIKAAISAARMARCSVQFEFAKVVVVVTPEDTYQGVQKRVGAEQEK